MGEAARRRRMAGAPTPGGFNAATGLPVTGKYAGQRLAEFAAEMLASPSGGGTRSVPCGDCRACCYSASVPVRPDLGDDPTRLDTVHADDGGLVLRRQADGACVHLGSTGCSVREYRPAVCRAYDCRIISAAGLGERYSNGEAMPAWFFDLDTVEDRALALGLRHGAGRAIAAARAGPFNIAEATQAAWLFALQNLSKARAVVEEFDRMPRAEQRRAFARFTRFAAKAMAASVSRTTPTGGGTSGLVAVLGVSCGSTDNHGHPQTKRRGPAVEETAGPIYSTPVERKPSNGTQPRGG